MDSDAESFESGAEYQDPTWSPIFRAVMDLDVQALRHELASGVDVNQRGEGGATPLYMAVNFRSSYAEEKLQERLECISMLLEAGASISNIGRDGTSLHYAARNESPAYHPVITLLIKSGADVNAVNYFGESVLELAAESGTAGAVRMLISAGAVDLDRALVLAIEHGKQRSCAPLMRAGAAIPAVITAPKPACSTPWEELVPTYSQTRAYVERVRATGGFKAYEKAHRQRLTAIFLAKFPALPVEMLERVVEFSCDVGGH